MAVGAEWRSTTELAVSETAGEATLEAGGREVDSFGTDDGLAVTSAESGRSTLAAVYVQNSSVQRTQLTVVWSLPDGLWHRLTPRHSERLCERSPRGSSTPAAPERVPSITGTGVPIDGS